VPHDVTTHRRVASAFYDHALRAVRDSGYPVIEMTDARQRGTGFGARFANAVADAFAQGYDQVLAVGSDCPRLHEVDWAAAAARLEEDTPVVGPTPDRDGTYLIGLTREQFDHSAFAALPWTTDALLPALEQYLRRRADTAPALLAPRDDVNGHADLLAVLAPTTAAPTALVAMLRRLLGASRLPSAPRPPRSRRRGRCHRSRAPPVRGAARPAG
jgi:hypothetical protein